MPLKPLDVICVRRDYVRGACAEAYQLLTPREDQPRHEATCPINEVITISIIGGARHALDYQLAVGRRYETIPSEWRQSFRPGREVLGQQRRRFARQAMLTIS